ncbi:hypothetical protein [Mumia zhuanghuii]|uniref:Uncharacterized protein n=1 Tax=Mumia zhuanghuii TaxID=2585211 RepID=A0A5C4MCI9_9ACTN|nr:hypothetical protein [Mumia zhuanghuii]TNC35684.1 hypothetical protein FHE65_26850 [Mumia zhuanghuii]TNC51699.1 hypothetical protein FHE65_01500 [Mumia zhuanghuii]
MPKNHPDVISPGPVLIERMVQRCSTRDDFPVEPGSSLSADDIASNPYRTSAVLRMSVTAAIDHLHAVKMLVVDQQLPQGTATWSLARGGLENLATAYWVLGPDRRDERIERTLRWHAQNVMDSDDATRHLDVPSTASAEARLSELDAVARRRLLEPAQVRRGYACTEAVDYAEAYLPPSGLGVRRPWQLSAGFTYGRPWAPAGAAVLETSSARPHVLGAGTSSAPGNVLYPYLAAVQLLEAFLRLYEVRAKTSLV